MIDLSSFFFVLNANDRGVDCRRRCRVVSGEGQLVEDTSLRYDARRAAIRSRRERFLSQIRRLFCRCCCCSVHQIDMHHRRRCRLFLASWEQRTCVYINKLPQRLFDHPASRGNVVQRGSAWPDRHDMLTGHSRYPAESCDALTGFFSCSVSPLSFESLRHHHSTFR